MLQVYNIIQIFFPYFCIIIILLLASDHKQCHWFMHLSLVVLPPTMEPHDLNLLLDWIALLPMSYYSYVCTHIFTSMAWYYILVLVCILVVLYIWQTQSLSIQYIHTE